MTPSFDELVGPEVQGSERERLERVHGLLLQAGPPPELVPELEAGPTLAMTMRRPRRRVHRRAMLLAAAIAVIVLAFLGGYVVGNSGGGSASGRILQLVGTQAAPHALASLRIEPKDAAGNWRMKLSVEGLPALPRGSYYEMYLVRNGKPWGSCGTFVVARKQGTVVWLNAPYRLKPGDSWVVTRTTPDMPEPGTVVLQPSPTT